MKERESRFQLFQEYARDINAKYGEAHRKSTKDTIHFKGLPDDGKPK